MSTDNAKSKSKLQGGECKSVPILPGTKSRGRLPRPGDPEPTLIRTYWPFGVLVLATLAIGIVIGRFLLS